MAKTSKAQRRASDKWDAKNREKKNYSVKRSTARGFIKRMHWDDYPEFRDLIDDKGEEIKLKKELKASQLNATYYDGDMSRYDLEFITQDGDYIDLYVDESDHPQAEHDEDYFDDDQLIDQIIEEADLENIEKR